MKSKYSESNMAGYEGLPSFPEFVDPTKTTANMNKYLLVGLVIIILAIVGAGVYVFTKKK